MEGVEEGRVGDGEEHRNDNEREGHYPTHPRERDERGQHAALPVRVAEEQVAPECLRSGDVSVISLVLSKEDASAAANG